METPCFVIKIIICLRENVRQNLMRFKIILNSKAFFLQLAQKKGSLEIEGTFLK